VKQGRCASQAASSWTANSRLRPPPDRTAAGLWHVERLPRHAGIVCPSCRTAPPIGPLWVCGACRTPFDVFETHATCTACHTGFASVRHSACGASHGIDAWAATANGPIA
jgi:hypothetical protein